MVLGKALGGGILPIAAVLARPELDVGAAYAFGHYTHEKNPVTTRAALTTIQIIEDEDLVENAAKVGASALARLYDMKSRHPLIGDVRGLGFLLGIELVTSRVSKSPAKEAAEAVMYRALEKGLSFKTTFGNVLTLTPPLTVTEAEMAQALDIIDEAIAERRGGEAVSATAHDPPRAARSARRDRADRGARRLCECALSAGEQSSARHLGAVALRRSRFWSCATAARRSAAARCCAIRAAGAR